MSEPSLVPAPGRATSVARVTRAWYVVCASDELGRAPIQRTLLDVPLVIFRANDGGGGVGALVDRCPHRNVPLSMGRVKNGELECAYHGWRFTTEGKCTKVPALVGISEGSARNADARPCREQDGFIWVWASATDAPDREPFSFPLLGDARYTSVRQRVVAESTLYAAAENALDVPHTSFLHAGLFRQDQPKRNRIDVVVRRWPDRVEAEYIGEPRPEGLVGRVLSPRGGVVKHFDRFLLPSIVQVEYELDAAHILVSAALTPESDYRTHLHAVVSFRLPIPGKPLVPFLKPLALRIFGQDASILARQTKNIRRFGEEAYVSTEVDVLGPHILRLLRAAERDRVSVDPSAAPAEKRFAMEI
ncbi:MAG: Rieske 2Fe-2S domain-containing protein [Sandaracinaceae bacterium]